MQVTEKTTGIIEGLRDLGVKVALDDFGTGFSSLSLLKALKLDILKIDPSFISDIATNINAVAILKNIIHMSHELNFIVIAKGIEEEIQAVILKQNNCDIGQGYLFERPLDCQQLQYRFNRGHS